MKGLLLAVDPPELLLPELALALLAGGCDVEVDVVFDEGLVPSKKSLLARELMRRPRRAMEEV